MVYSIVFISLTDMVYIIVELYANEGYTISSSVEQMFIKLATISSKDTSSDNGAVVFLKVIFKLLQGDKMKNVIAVVWDFDKTLIDGGICKIRFLKSIILTVLNSG